MRVFLCDCGCVYRHGALAVVPHVAPPRQRGVVEHMDHERLVALSVPVQLVLQ
jgi:hypothetical protein